MDLRRETSSDKSNGSKNKICPFLTIAVGGEFLAECVEEDCMFWNSEKGECILVTVAKKLIG